MLTFTKLYFIQKSQISLFYKFFSSVVIFNYFFFIYQIKILWCVLHLSELFFNLKDNNI